MMRYLAALLIALCILPSALARLGETETQLIERFGEPRTRSQHSIFAQGKFIPLGPQLIFKEGDWTITCDLIDGRCLRIKYSKPGDWTDDQFVLVLNSNGQGATWTETSNVKVKNLQRSWKRSDGSTAQWQKLTGITLTWDAYTKAKAKAEERARVEAARKPKI